MAQELELPRATDFSGQPHQQVTVEIELVEGGELTDLGRQLDEILRWERKAGWEGSGLSAR